jgi:hypothetical protein
MGCNRHGNKALRDLLYNLFQTSYSQCTRMYMHVFGRYTLQFVSNIIFLVYRPVHACTRMYIPRKFKVALDDFK